MTDRLPDAPQGIRYVQTEKSLSVIELATQLMMGGTPTLIGGLSLLGESGYICRTVAILQVLKPQSLVEGSLRGWNFFAGHPDLSLNAPRYIDTARDIQTSLAIPNTITYFVAEADPELVEENVNPNRLQEIIDFTLTFIHD